jgi:hypothetical protein
MRSFGNVWEAGGVYGGFDQVKQAYVRDFFHKIKLHFLTAQISYFR